ncbi:jg17595, partial [Pararge aegeria aegeria]
MKFLKLGREGKGAHVNNPNGMPLSQYLEPNELPPPPAEPAPSPPEHSSIPTDPELLHGTGLSYYD